MTDWLFIALLVPVMIATAKIAIAYQKNKCGSSFSMGVTLECVESPQKMHYAH